jgi:hypothetical protein
MRCAENVMKWSGVCVSHQYQQHHMPYILKLITLADVMKWSIKSPSTSLCCFKSLLLSLTLIQIKSPFTMSFTLYPSQYL